MANFPVEAKKVIKPYYNVRQANRLQTAAAAMQASQAKLSEEQEASTMSAIATLSESTFTKFKSKAVQRREANQLRRQSFNESLCHMIATIAYGAMPVDEKTPLSETISGENSAFQAVSGSVSTMMFGDPAISMSLNDMYSRQSGAMQPAAGGAVGASQYAVNLALSYNPLSNAPLAVKKQLPLDEDPSKVISTTQSYIDQLVVMGDPDQSVLTKTPEQDVAERAYNEFVELSIGKVELSVLRTLKEEAEIAELTQFLAEETKDDMYAKSANRSVMLSAKKPSVFREVFKTVKVLAEGKEYREEILMSEAIAQFTILETFNTLGMLNRTKEQVIAECFNIRKANNVAK